MRNRSVFTRYTGFRSVLWGLLLYAVLALVGQNKAWPDVVAETLAPPLFSHDSGFYDQPFDLVLTYPDPGVQIFYTLDGSIPDPDNLDGTRYHYKNEYAAPPGPPTGELLHAEYRTLLYTDGIPIRDRTGEPDRLANISTTFDNKPDYFPGAKPTNPGGLNAVIRQANRGLRELNRVGNRVERKLRRLMSGDGYQHIRKEYIPMIPYRPPYTYTYKGTVVRAMAVDADGARSSVATKSFFIGRRDDFTLPVVSLVAPPDRLFDYRSGVLVAGQDYDDWLLTGDDLNIPVHRRPGNWRRRGVDIPAHMSIFDLGADLRVATDVGIRVHGGASRIFRFKSFRVYPRLKYSAGGVDYDLFKTGSELGRNRFILRNGGNEYAATYIKDAAVQAIMTGLNFGTQRYAPVVTFLNGEYHGILNARDRIDQYYLADRYSLPTRAVDLLKNKSVVRGSLVQWNQVLQYVAEESADDDAFLSGLEELIDVDSFIDYHVANIFIRNTDWPHNNIAYWRYRGSGSPSDHTPGPADGRWRWLMYDTDHAFKMSKVDGVEHNTLLYATDPESAGRPDREWSTFMLRTLITNPQFRERFIIRFSDLLNSTFQPARMVHIIRQLQAGIEAEMPRHIQRWSAPRSISRWHERIDEMVEFAEKRPEIQWGHLREFFDLGASHTLSVDASDRNAGMVRVNTLQLGRTSSDTWEDAVDRVLAFPWSGTYFQDLPVQLEALPAAGYRFSHWEAAGLTPKQAESPVLTLSLTDDMAVRAVMEIVQ